MRYDLVVIGSGPSGQKAAIAASKLGKRVALVERRREELGGVCLHHGTIPSKTMREAIMHLTGYRQRGVYGEQFRNKRHITMNDLRKKLTQVVNHELSVLHEHFDRNGVDVHTGTASFVDAHTVAVTGSGTTVNLYGERILIACGTRPARPKHIPFDGVNVIDSDELLEIEDIPRSMIVIGGGVIGMEYALMFATLGVECTVVDGRERLLEFCDREIIETLMYHARSLGIVFRLGEDVTGVDRLRNGMVSVKLESGKRLIAETALYSAGRTGDTEDMNLKAAGLETDERGKLWCNEKFQTWQPHIYGVGDVIGFPALASAAMEQGRRAVCAMFDRPATAPKNMPYGLFTIPEISMIGKTEQQLTAEKVPYEVGIGSFREIARGHISGEEHGMLKLLFHRETKLVLGVHCIGDTATEIIHTGQAVMSLGGTIDYFRDTVFNYPTMTEAYKVAAFNGLNKINLEMAGSAVVEGSELSQQIEATLNELEQELEAVAAGV